MQTGLIKDQKILALFYSMLIMTKILICTLPAEVMKIPHGRLLTGTVFLSMKEAEISKKIQPYFLSIITARVVSKPAILTRMVISICLLVEELNPGDIPGLFHLLFTGMIQKTALSNSPMLLPGLRRN